MFKITLRKKGEKGCGNIGKNNSYHKYADGKRHEMLGIFGLVEAAVPGEKHKGRENW